MRLALRQLARSPGFAFVVIATLALCIGANSAIFSVVNAVLLRPFPYPEADRLVYINNSHPKNDLPNTRVSIPDYLDRVERAAAIEQATLYTWDSANLAADGRPRRVAAVRATPSIFPVLRATPVLGRAFDASHATPGNDRVAVLSHSLWHDTYGARLEIVGETIRLNGEPYVVLGVMPEGFTFPLRGVQLWTPFAFTPEQRADDERGHESAWMLARLKPGATAAQLQQECTTIIAQNLARLPELRERTALTGFTASVVTFADQFVAGQRPTLWLLQAGVMAALLIGCANVANLLLTRAAARERELAIRAALGASRWQLARQLGIESMILFVAGGALSWLVAMWGLSTADRFNVAELPGGEAVLLDRTVFLFTLLSVALTGLVFGLLPALQAAKADAGDALRDAGARNTANRRQRRFRHGLVVAEVALSVMLLTTAGLLYRSFERLQAQPPGFDESSVLTARLTLPTAKYPTADQRRHVAGRFVEEIGALPGVIAVGLTDVVPFTHYSVQSPYAIVGRERPDGHVPPHGLIRSVSPEYFATMKIPLLRGRTFTAADTGESERVVVIDRVLADRYWPGADPLGEYIHLAADEAGTRRQIVGVVAPVKHSGLEDSMSRETLYFPYSQRPVESFMLVLRTALPPYQLLGQVRKAVAGVDPEQPLFDVASLADRIDGRLQRQRTPMQLLGLFSGMALVLAALGVYGVLAFSVSQRTQEFGIRAALGATTRQVVGLVLRQGVLLVTVGIVLGLCGYVSVSRVLQHLVFHISPLDPVSLVLGPLVLFVIALLACLLPARRATRVDPVVALRAR